MAAPSWYNRALGYVGTKETPGSASNPVIVDFWKLAKLAGIKDDSTPWCAGFVNAMLERSLIRGTRSAAARSFEHWGTGLHEPALGCIVVLSRPPSSWQGHVGFYAGETETQVRILGGNQGDSVSFALFNKSRVLGYRWPIEVDLPRTGKIILNSTGTEPEPSDR